LNKKINWIFNQNKESLEKQQTQNINLKTYRCPRCNHIITLDNKQIQNTALHCPLCGQQNILKLPREQPEKKYGESNINYWFFQLNKNAVIIGLILIFFSIFPLFISNPFSIKLNLTLLTIGIIIPLFIIEKKRNISLKITFSIIIFIILLFFITGTDIEIFLILIFLGILLTKIMIDEYLPTDLKIRMNIFISAFFIIFIIIVIKRIINVVNI